MKPSSIIYSYDRRSVGLKTGSSRVAIRVAELLPYDYDSLLFGAKTGKKTGEGMDVFDNKRVPIPDSVTPDTLEKIMLAGGKKYPKGGYVVLYGLGSGILDALMIWTPGRGFAVPDYGWEASNLSRTTRRKVVQWINGRGKNPALE